MHWHRVEIHTMEESTSAQAAGALFNGYEANLGAATDLSRVEVYHLRLSPFDHTFLFSPDASAVLAANLKQFRAVPCDGVPDLTGFRKVRM